MPVTDRVSRNVFTMTVFFCITPAVCTQSHPDGSTGSISAKVRVPTYNQVRHHVAYTTIIDCNNAPRLYGHQCCRVFFRRYFLRTFSNKLGPHNEDSIRIHCRVHDIHIWAEQRPPCSELSSAVFFSVNDDAAEGCRKDVYVG